MVADSASTQTAMVAILGAGGGASATAVAVFFLKDFFATTKKDLGGLTKAVTELVTELRTATRDLRKIEGVIEGQQKQLTDIVKELSGSTANVKALWAALQRIHPAAIPRRLSDSDTNGR